mgnify:FL=1
MTEIEQITRWLEEAIALGLRGMERGDGGPFGAVIVREGVVIARGWNQVLTTHDPTAHAEIVALREAASHLKRDHLEDCLLFSSCEPCPMCLAALYWARIQMVYFAADRHDAAAAGFADEFLYRELVRPPSQRMIPFRHHPLPQAQDAFRRFRSQPNVRLYGPPPPCPP